MASIPTLLVLAATVASQPRGEVLDFSATWCGPCQRMSPLVSRLEREGLPIRKVDVDRERELARRYNVQSIPTFVLVVDGEEVTRIVGMTTESDLRRLIARIPRTAAPAAETPFVADRDREASSRDPSAQVPREQAQPALVQQQPADEPPPRRGLLDIFRGRDSTAEPQRLVRANDAEVPSRARIGDAEDPMAGAARIRVRIDGRINLGSGTVIGSRPGTTLVLTCGHIFRGLNDTTKIEVDLFEGETARTYVGSVVDFDEDADVGLITVPTDRALPAVAVCPPESVPAQGDRVACIGCSGGDAPSREQLLVTAVNKYTGPDNIECTGIPVQGRSGGGLFNASGELIGVCIAADPEGQRGLYAHVHTVHQLLDACNLTPLYQPPQPEDAVIVAAVEEPAAVEPEFVSNDAAPEPATQPTTDTDGPAEFAGITDIPAGDAEVVVIIRPRNQPEAASRVVIINQASPKFFAYLNGELQAPPTEGMTAQRMMQTSQSVEEPSTPSWYHESRRMIDSDANRSPDDAHRSDKETLRPTSLWRTADPRRYVRSAAR